ncbi:aminopeptidase [Megasphaera sp.]|uniref:aminopeptidase n=1 Tax=Megasphaera TaxID=906 RepID=UPI001DB28A48|nr:aminopeptidase [Megasphaera sp.]MBS6789056.1 aminopeptidase [Megasphaera sp.]
MEILKGAEVLLTTCSNCGKDEKIAIVTDPTSYEAAKALYDAAKDFKNKSLLLMDERNMHGQEPTDLIAAAMLEADVIFGATKFSLFHSNARRKAVEAGARFVNMADYDVDMLKSGGLFADFEKIGETCTKIAEVLEGKKTCTVTSKNGTNFTCSIADRAPNPQYGRSLKKNSSSSPPDIECATCAVENTGNGIIVVDGSIPHPLLGVIKEPIKLTVENSLVTKVEGGKEAEILKKIWEEANDPNVYNIGEIGIGLNDECDLIGKMLEDEGCYGTLHFGAGDNIGFGGKVKSKYHLDLIIKNPHMSVDGVKILVDGNVVL